MKNTIMPALMKSLSLVSSFAFLLVLGANKVAAQGVIPVTDVNVGSSIGGISTLNEIVFFILNLLKYLGWAGVVIGVGLAIFGLIYKLMNEDNQKVMETVQGYITKAVVIVMAGIILISFGFIIEVVANLFGLGPAVGLNPEDVLNDGSGGGGNIPE